MLRGSIEARLRDEHGEDGYLFPAYDDYCFANIPHTAASVLGADTGRTLPDDVFEGVRTRADTVLVVLIDGFGLDAWKRDGREHDLLRRIDDRGVVTPLTSTYPSETAAAITSFHTGRLAAEHGVIGWNVYEPRTDEAFEALPFERKDGARPALDPDDLYEAEPIYPTLRAEGIDARHVVPFPETYEGACAHTYGTTDEFASRLGEALAAADPPAYVFAYLPHVDHVSHEAGTESRAYREALSSICAAVEEALRDLDPGTAEDALVLLTADHGHVDTDPERNVDLSAFDAVTENLRTHADGAPIRFAGSPRNVHLHLEPGSVEEVRATLRSELDAYILTREDVLEMELFGPDPSETFRRRLGDLVLIHRDLGVWWGDAEPEELEHVGMHGGLNPDEMLVPFAAVELPELRR